MPYKIGLPSLKLKMVVDAKTKHTGSLQAVAAEALEERKGRDQDIDRSKTAMNEIDGFRSAKELIEYSDRHVAELTTKQRAVGQRGIHSNAVRMCATIIKPPVAMMADLTQLQQRQLLHDGVAKLAEIVGPDNVKSVAYHFDEIGAHAHVFWEPMTKDGRLCGKEIHSRPFFNRVNKEMPAYLRDHGWDVADCNCFDAEEHKLTDLETAEKQQTNGRSSATYKLEAEKARQEALEETDRLHSEAAGLQDAIEKLEPLRAEYEAKKELVENNYQAVLPDEAVISTQGFGKKKKQYVTVPRELFEARWTCADLLDGVKKAMATLDARISAFWETAAGQYIQKLQAEVERLRARINEVSEEKDKKINVLETELGHRRDFLAQHNLETKYQQQHPDPDRGRSIADKILAPEAPAQPAGYQHGTIDDVLGR